MPRGRVGRTPGRRSFWGPRVARVGMVLDVFRLRCPLSWMSFVLDALCLGCLLSWMPFVLDAGRCRLLGPRRCASCAALPLSWGARAPLAPNAGPQPHRGAVQCDACQRRTALPGVGCRRLLGARPGTASRVPSPCPEGGWAGRPGDAAPRGRGSLGCVWSWMSFVFDAPCLGCRSSSMPFVLDVFRLRCHLSRMLAVVGRLGHGDARRVLPPRVLGFPRASGA